MFHWKRGSISVLRASVLILFISNLQVIKSQGVPRQFPKLFNAAGSKPITTNPADATCGSSQPVAFCKSSTFAQSVSTCSQDYCNQTCPLRNTLPANPVDLLSATGYGTGQSDDCVVTDGVMLRPKAPSGSISTRFEPSSRTDCFLTPIIKPTFGSNGAFTLTVWIYRKQDGDQTLFEKGVSGGAVVFSLQIVGSRLFVQYGLNQIQLQEIIAMTTWTHIAIQVYDKSLSVFKDGVGVGFSAAETVTMVNQIQDLSTAISRVGQSINGTQPFVGNIQDFKFYMETLSNREIEEVYSGILPEVHTQSSCRCPPSHPRVKVNQDRYCIRNGVPDNTGDELTRLNVYAHPLEYLNDGDSNSIWISTFGSDITINVDLEDEYQVFYVVMQFYSPFPKILSVKRKKTDASQWETWQLYAEDCTSTFGLPNGGALNQPDSTNCLPLGSNVTTVPYSKGNVTYVILSSEPVARPGHNDFYGTPELFEFVQASQVQIRLQDHYYVNNPRHEYFGLYDLIVTARCNCHGHAENCTRDIPYKCMCAQDSFTSGDRCDTCLPLYNDKPFHVGDQVNAFNCKVCTCNDHADSCVYNASMDAFPAEHERGGGGVCVNCQHNTQGRFCEECKATFYRPTNKPLNDVGVCSLCACNTAGTVNANTICEKVGGQCECKSNVTGRTCGQCVDGFFNLQSTTTSGCEACNCDTAGTVGNGITCNSNSGKCECKKNVLADNGKCNECKYGFYNLDSNNAQGCTACTCNAKGVSSTICNRLNGQCPCIPNVIGMNCDECADGFYNFEKKCLPCGCNVDGTQPGNHCNKTTGHCVCKKNVGGEKCDVCLDGYYDFNSDPVFGCQDCGCNKLGTVNGSHICNNVTGVCDCKQHVTGVTCNQCQGNSWNLSMSNPTGCQLCECDHTGTVNGATTPQISLACDANTGACACVSNRYGRQCDKCVDGYKLRHCPACGCNACGCHAPGTRLNSVCDQSSGQCECKDGWDGFDCSGCKPGFYRQAGTCAPCNCNAAGTEPGTSCDVISGACQCKQLVEGAACDQCKAGASKLDASNTYGCSKSPAQQGQPTRTEIDPNTLTISWLPPDEPNGIVREYKLYRDSTVIVTVPSNQSLSFNDTGLQPFTTYRYKVEVFNDHGSAMSRDAIFKTPAGQPEGTLTLLVGSVGDKSAYLSWNIPAKTNGPLEKYVIEAQSLTDPPTVLWEGLQLSVILTNLVPFTNYTMVVKACTTGGCLESPPVLVFTQQGLPAGQLAPVISALSATSLFVKWSHPSNPNGIIIFYELWMKTTGTVAKRVYLSAGQYNPRPTLAPQENALPEPQTNFTVQDLKPYTEYEFQVFAQNEKGKVSSPWAIGRTKEAMPLSTPAPVIVPISSSELNVTWTMPHPSEGRGEVIKVRVFQEKETDLTLKPYDPPLYNDEIHVTGGSDGSFIVSGLPAYSSHVFFVETCNSIGCINSTQASGRSLAAPPKNQMAPAVTGYNVSVMSVNWDPPAQINGPAPDYLIEKTMTSFNIPPPRVIRGTRFPGGGYHLFPPETIPQGVGFTGIDLWFKTSQDTGLLLFAASEGRQDEFIVVQLRNGRPWFLFDPQGCESLVEPDPTQDGNRTYNDNQWHHVVATRSSSSGSITIDGVYQGCSTILTTTNDEGAPYADNKWHHLRVIRYRQQAFIEMDSKWTGTRVGSCSTGNVIGSNTGVYIGGLPSDFVIKRVETDGRAKVIRQGFQGCLKDVKIMTQETPVPVWVDIEWNNALKIADSFPSWEGCPVSLETGVHFLGRGYVQVGSAGFTGGSDFTIEMKIRTEMKSGLLFFMYGNNGVYMYARLVERSIQWYYQMGSAIRKNVIFSNNNIVICDGQWKTVSFIKRGQQITVNVDGIEQSQGSSSALVDLYLDSDLYFGGLNSTYPPVAKVIAENGLGSILQGSFSGCFQYVKVNNQTVSFIGSLESMLNVNMDGCPAVITSSSTCQTDSLQQVYSGPANQTYDYGLNAFTEYNYRVTASNSAGSSTSEWAVGRTREGAPTGVDAPFDVKTYTGYVIEAKWNEPTGNTGYITEYKLRAHNVQDTGKAPAEASFIEPPSLHGNITDAVPFTNYSVVLVACTLGGCTESSSGVHVTTREEAPSHVQPVEVEERGAYWMSIKWPLPLFPNGIITGYILHQDGLEVYNGGQRTFNVTNLQVYTSYSFSVEACTQVGCNSSVSVRESTSQLPPTFMEPPTIIVLGARSVKVEWKEAAQLNGILERYQLYLSLNGAQNGELIYDNADFFLNYAIYNLTAGTTYYIRAAACTGGGCRLSAPSSATTLESSPEGIRLPTVTSPTPSQLVVEWLPPIFPNGVIIRYELYQNGLLVYNASGRRHEISGLQPYSRHVISLKACTKKGCGTSLDVIAYTQEAAPTGDITFEIFGNTSRSVLARWSNVPQPNGVIDYTVYFEGLFYVDPANWNYNTVRERRALFSGQFYGVLVYIDKLLPNSDYNVQVNASNSKGFLLSAVLRAEMPMGSPDGVKPPVLTSPDSTSVRAIWQQVGRFNSNEQPAFQLQFRGTSGFVEDLFSNPTTSTTFLKSNLDPYTLYDFRLVASNTYGQTPTPWVSIYTKQDVPERTDPPMTRNVKSREMDVVWTAPLRPNGIITEYRIYANNILKETIAGNMTQLTVKSLTPYTWYVFTIGACTIAGCSRSGASNRERTLPAEPEGIPTPTLLSETPTSVLIAWTAPTKPNGILIGYSIQRRTKGEDTVVSVRSLNMNEGRQHVDESDQLKPYTIYEYRITASTALGIGYGPWGQVTTKSSRPSPMSPPTVRAVSPTAVVVEWQPPVSANGRLERYLIKMPEPQIEVRNTSVLSLDVNDLVPYTQYSVTVTACTDGGCTESPATVITTAATKPAGISPPTTTPVSRTVIQVNWERPLRPNGPNLVYELSRKKISQPLDSTATGFGFWQNVYSGAITNYEDRGLTIFTTYVYRVMAINSEGILLSESSDEVSTHGGVPQKPAVVSATPVSHVSIQVSWTTPGVIDLQGRVEVFRVVANPGTNPLVREFGRDVNSTVITGLQPNTLYEMSVTLVINGGESITSVPVYATTLDGAPEGLSPPQLFVVSNTALRVVWTNPSQPNGAITGFFIYVDNTKIDPNMNTAGSYLLTNLQPYTVYSVQVEVCTQFACLKSTPTRGTTAESEPGQMALPNLQTISPYSIDITWTQPAAPNGIIIRYDLIRRTIQDCSKILPPTEVPDADKCTYIECGLLQGVCGTQCFSGAKTCCNGVLYDNAAGHNCCGDKYIPGGSNPNDVCCGGKFHVKQTNFQCCGERYVEVLPGQICCPDANEDRVDIGVGDQCCGSVPFSSTGSQICCNNDLYDGFNKQCCGNQMVGSNMACCGGSTNGQAFLANSQYFCCGMEYANNSTSSCCTSDTGKTKVHTYGSQLEKMNANEVCCGIEMISSGLSCCSSVSYNPLTQVCADRSSQTTGGCGMGMTCAIGQSSSARCDRCDFDTNSLVCHPVEGDHTPTTPAPVTSAPSTCTSGAEKIFSGLVFNYRDVNLKPWTRYEYAVVAVNKAGSRMSNYAAINTSQALPQGLQPPVANIPDNRVDLIQLVWKPPLEPHGEILRYILYRSNIEIHRGLGLTYTDSSNIQPYKTYVYKVQACNIEGCIESEQVEVATLEAVPEGVSPPTVSAINSTALQLTWNPPSQPNGIIVKYTLFSDVQRLVELPSQQLLYITTGLLPFTEYKFLLSACSRAGCTNSTLVSGFTMEDKPAGVMRPRAVIVSNAIVELFWQAPSSPNGVITKYTLYRQGVSIYQDNTDSYHYRDSGLIPGGQYSYIIEATNKAGSTRSAVASVIMPTLTPEGIPAPSVTALSSTSISVSWSAPSSPNGQIDQYRVMQNGGSASEVIHPVSAGNQLNISNLSPYTMYSIRIQACLQGQANGCGTGPASAVTTLEAPPLGLAAPRLTALGATVIRIEWQKPSHPNGVILYYDLYQRVAGTQLELLVNRLSSTTYFYLVAGTSLAPFTEYEFKLIVTNSVGNDVSDWSRVRTLEAAPEGMLVPTAIAESAYAIRVTWQLPVKPNGVITMFKVEYQQKLDDPTLTAPTHSVTVQGNVLSTSFSGLLPFTNYKVRVMAVNSAGQTTSPFTEVKTKEAAPADIKPFRVEKMTNGQSVILRWDPPGKPNGVISTYRIYDNLNTKQWEGSQREFEYLRLMPYTKYFVLLEACTPAGCARSNVQSFFSAEVAPLNLAAPGFGISNATHIVINWVAPVTPNGKIIEYAVFRKDVGPVSKRAVDEGNRVFSTNDTDGDRFQYVDGGLTPHYRYEYRVRACNSINCIDSDWTLKTTEQAAPSGVIPPTVEYYGGQPDELRITWSPPEKANGVIQNYQLQRNQNVPLNFPVTAIREYIDRGLTAYTVYRYTLTVCTAGGCTTSQPTLKRTQETAPLNVNPPMVNAVNSTAIQAVWTKPQITNGEVTHYQLLVDNVVQYSGLALEYLVVGLIPYKEYRFILSACTGGGCTASNSVIGRPTEARPLGLQAPVLRVLSSRTIEVSWRIPDSPNGVILAYELRRDNILLYDGPNTNYTNFNLEPGVSYSYQVLARNSQGSVSSSVSTARTFSSSPEGLLPPVLTAVSSTEIRAVWQAPAKPNGVIRNYTLSKTDEVVFTGNLLEYLVPGLEFYTEYSFRVQACTDKGCFTSLSSRERTMPALPIGMNKPILQAQADAQGAHAGILIDWTLPTRPNGQILGYKLYRRTLTKSSGSTAPVYGIAALVYNGTSRTFTDTNLVILKPFSEYQYKVSALNSVGEVESDWQTIRTLQAPPEGLLPPTAQPTANTIKVTVQAPSVPNGYINSYNIILNGTLVSSSQSLEQTIGKNIALQPFTWYAVQVEACTAGGCTRSDVTHVKTTEDVPLGLAAVTVVSVNSTTAALEWTNPQFPNGVIRRYELQMRTACPAPEQPLQAQQTCVVGQSSLAYSGLATKHTVGKLVPYTSYEFQLSVYNDVGGVNQPGWTLASTSSAAPEYLFPPTLKKNGTLVVVTWTASFKPNGRIVEISLYSNGQKTYSGYGNTASIERETKDKVYTFYVQLKTNEGTVRTPDVVFDPNAPGVVSTTQGTGVTSPQVLPFYQEVWFIALVCVIALLLLFTGIAFCLRSTGTKAPYVRERMPLQPRPRKDAGSPLYCVDTYDGSIITTDIARAPSHASLRHIQAGFVNPAYSHSSLPRSLPHSRTSSVVDLSDKFSKSSKFLDEEDDAAWDGYMPDQHDQFEDDNISTRSGRPYSVMKEHTMFTDTHL